MASSQIHRKPLASNSYQTHSPLLFTEELIEPPVTELSPQKQKRRPVLGLLRNYGVFAALIQTTVISSLLLAGNAHDWTLSKDVYQTVIQKRASTQLVIQVIANGLGLLHVTVMYVLINYSTRLRFTSVATSLDTLRFWNSLLTRQFDWTLPLHFLVPLLLFIGLGVVPSALWAGAITPVSVTAFQQGTIPVSSYSNTSLLYQNWTHRDGLPSIRNSKGFFTYNVGEALLGSLLVSASLATTADGSVRQHAKIDFSRFSYNGRSYGVGASVGIIDDNLIFDPLVTKYTFEEAGYAPKVKCIYNTSSQYFLSQVSETGDGKIFVASGLLPNSVQGQQEWSRYPGFSTDSIVAIGVATSVNATPRMIGIASGQKYATLNNTQCTIDFQPTLFNVTVDLVDRNITVMPLEAFSNTTDIEPSGQLTFLTTWQLTLISTDQTSLYSSLIGNSISTSVTNYINSVASGGADPPSDVEATLTGLRNSVAAMIDDMLVLYASAQIMVANDTQTVPTVIERKALRLGEPVYTISIAVLNTLLILFVIIEAIRTRGWRRLVDFDYMNPRNLVIASSRGGRGIAEAVDAVEASKNVDPGKKKIGSIAANNIGNIYIINKGSRIVGVGNSLADENEVERPPV